VVSAPWRLTFAAPISRVVLSAGGSALAVGVGVFPQATCRARDSAPVVLALPVSCRARLEEIIALRMKILARSLIRPTVSQN